MRKNTATKALKAIIPNPIQSRHRHADLFGSPVPNSKVALMICIHLTSR